MRVGFDWHARPFNTTGTHAPLTRLARTTRWFTRRRCVPESDYRFSVELYPTQTKILEGGTRDEMRMFEALFKGVSTQFGPWSIEKYIEHPHFISCSSFQNLRLGSINSQEDSVMLCVTLCVSHPCSEQKIAQFYAPQTKILEGSTNLSECVFETIFNDS